MICPECGNVWNPRDPENNVAAAARQRMPIVVLETIAHEMDEQVLIIRCTACGTESGGNFKRGRRQPDK